MVSHNEYFYKGYDISNKNKLEQITMGEFNPYGNNIDSNNRRIVDYNKICSRTNQDLVKSKELIEKKK